MFPNTEGTMPTVTKMHFIEMLKEHVGLSRAEANEVVDSIFDEMQQALSEGREIKLANFGTFSTRDKQARPGRNPRTGRALRDQRSARGDVPAGTVHA